MGGTGAPEGLPASRSPGGMIRAVDTEHNSTEPPATRTEPREAKAHGIWDDFTFSVRLAVKFWGGRFPESVSVVVFLGL
ncbi:hypothetical protein COCON_G00219070 [Conger conger]|uniref:Uncharacterized protein n=1 Tax=Conger conger TaxID=82655 RepID=A0A9Q1CYM0_CONCO|nr:hypothetical protein COCON_G00219070 [Conger conger]